MGYCTKCGRQISYDSPICVECVGAAKNASQQTSASPTQVPLYVQAFPQLSYQNNQPVINLRDDRSYTSRMIGFGRALAGMILAFFSFVIMIGIVDSGFDDESALLWLFFALPMQIISLIFGIKSIKVYSSYTLAKPIPSLVLGICATVLSAVSMTMIVFS